MPESGAFAECPLPALSQRWVPSPRRLTTLNRRFHAMLDLSAARDLIANAKRIVVLTGAGISAESGVPTFRGEGGLWKNFRAEDLATPEAFARDPAFVWEWYRWRQALVARCLPNEAHHALTDLAIRRAGVTIITQNVDGLHARAAYDVAPVADPAPALPIELHGSLFRSRCVACGALSDSGPVDDVDIPAAPIADDAESPSAHRACCTDCDGAIRPDVVWFGEMLDPAIIGKAQQLSSEADVCLVIGTSGLVHPAAGLAFLTKQSGGAVIEVNPEPTPITDIATISIRGTAVDVVPALVL